MTKRYWVPFALNGDLRVTGYRIGVEEIDLESHADERIGERKHEIRGDSCAPAPDDELWEFQRRVIGRRDVLHVDWHVK